MKRRLSFFCDALAHDLLVVFGKVRSKKTPWFAFGLIFVICAIIYIGFSQVGPLVGYVLFSAIYGDWSIREEYLAEVIFRPLLYVVPSLFMSSVTVIFAWLCVRRFSKGQ